MIHSTIRITINKKCMKRKMDDTINAIIANPNPKLKMNKMIYEQETKKRWENLDLEVNSE